MPAQIEVTEKYDSRRLLVSRDGKASTFTMLLTVRGSMDQYAVKHAASSFAPETWGSSYPFLWKQQVEVQCIGHELWEAVVRYDTSAPEPLSANDSFAFDISGGTQHITQSFATASYPPGAPDEFGSIGVTEDGVQGADIYSPEMTFEETHFFAELSPTYKATLFLLRGRMNESSFRGWAGGEVLFEGVSARRQDNRYQTPWSVTYRFRVSPNATLSIAGVGDIDKAGWDLLDIRYEPTVEDNSLLHRPTRVYVHRVYRTADFSLLGIGN